MTDTARRVIQIALSEHSDGNYPPEEFETHTDLILKHLADAGYAFMRPWNDETDGEMTVVVLNEDLGRLTKRDTD